MSPLPYALTQYAAGVVLPPIRQEAWDTYEMHEWVTATRTRGLSVLQLPVEIQKKILAKLDEGSRRSTD